MTVWLVVEGDPQIVRADSIVSFTIAAVKPTGDRKADPLDNLPRYGLMQILAATASARDADMIPRTVLATFKGNGRKDAPKALSDLAEAIDKAEQRTRSPGGKQVQYVHGPPPWSVSEELPTRPWPHSKDVPVS